MMRARSLLVLGAAGAIAGCELEPGHDSGEVSTRDLQVSVEASDEGSGAAVRIELTGPNPIGNLRLSGGDSLSLSIAGVAWPLREIEADGRFAYEAHPDGLVEDLVLDLVRSEDRSALDVGIPAPPPFTLTAAGLTGGEPLTMAWDAAPGEHALDLRLEGDCIGSFFRPLATDVGAYAVSQAELPLPTSLPCPLRVTLTRTSTTQRPLLPGIEGGNVYAHIVQRRATEVQWLP